VRCFFFKVIRALDPKLNPASAEIQLLKAQLSEKDKRINALEVELPSFLTKRFFIHVQLFAIRIVILSSLLFLYSCLFLSNIYPAGV